VKQINCKLKSARTFVNLADLEYSLITPKNFEYIKDSGKRKKQMG
jgi:hypothetical protein